MKGVIRGVPYTVRRARLRTHRGDCDSPRRKNPEIRISSSLEGEEELEVLLHECLHAAYWDLSEEAVCDPAVDIAKVLWDWGYRKVNDDGRTTRPDRP